MDVLFETWKRAKIIKDENIMNCLNEIGQTYGYTIEEGFGIHIRKVRRSYREPKYAEVTYSGIENFTINTVSSHWDVNEATIFMKQLKQATECAAELNAFLASLEGFLKKEYEKEMAEREKNLG